MNKPMDCRLTVRLPANLRRALHQASRKTNRSENEIVRMALSQFLRVPLKTANRPIERVRDLIGSLESGLSDLANGKL